MDRRFHHAWPSPLGTDKKAEPTPPEGKRPSIPVTVQATHDNENLFMRFQWEGTEHVPVPFVDGGKMDTANQAKQLGCHVRHKQGQIRLTGRLLGHCHEDLRTMPGHPEDPARQEAGGVGIS